MSSVMYRPPFEADSFLLEVTEGCSHNRCSFCTMYRDVPYRMLETEAVENQLKKAQPYAARIERVFLEHGDPFSLSAGRLLAAADLVHRYLSQVQTIAMYASINNIRTKTDAELRELRAAGINELNIGIESGLDDALRKMNKGYSASEALRQLTRLEEAGILYGANVIFGCAGRALRKEHARATADLLNRTHPYLIFTGTIHADPGCELHEEMQNGTFCENTVGEYLEEEELFLSLLDLPETFFFGLHPSNIIRMQGWLMRDRERMLEEIGRQRERLSAYFDWNVKRGAEGAAYL